MFETSTVRANATAAPRRAGLLSVSVAVHAFVLTGAVVVSVASVEFPHNVPRQMEMLQLVAKVEIPKPLGNPNGGAPKPKPQQPVATPPRPQPLPSQPTAPNVVPDKVEPATPIASTEPATPGTGDPNVGPGTEPGPFGDPHGDPNMPNIGQMDQPPAAPQPEKIYTVSGDVKAPRVISRVDPIYPQAMLRVRMSAIVRVRCIIDKTGRVRDAEVIVSSFPPFNQAVTEAVQKWRFAPGTLHGQAVDTQFDLTVNFQAR